MASPCKSCGRTKPESEFYVSNKSHCKECVKARVRRRARTNPAVQEYERARAKTPERRDKARKNRKRWRSENPDRAKAHSAVNYAVRTKKIEKEPCVFCGRTDVHAHHEDYSRPLDIVWLCPKCHHRLHAIFPDKLEEGLAR